MRDCPPLVGCFQMSALEELWKAKPDASLADLDVTAMASDDAEHITPVALRYTDASQYQVHRRSPLRGRDVCVRSRSGEAAPRSPGTLRFLWLEAWLRPGDAPLSLDCPVHACAVGLPAAHQDGGRPRQGAAGAAEAGGAVGAMGHGPQQEAPGLLLLPSGECFGRHLTQCVHARRCTQALLHMWRLRNSGNSRHLDVTGRRLSSSENSCCCCCCRTPLAVGLLTVAGRCGGPADPG